MTSYLNALHGAQARSTLPTLGTQSARTAARRAGVNFASGMQAEKVARDTATISQAARSARLQDGLAATANAVSNYYMGATQSLGELANVSTALSDRSARTGSLAADIGMFVDGYNSALGQVQQAGTTGAAGAAGGDASTTILQQSLANVVGAPQMSASGSFNQLSQIGITRNGDGSLSLDAAALDAAISADAASVASIFSTDPATQTPGLAAQVGELAQSYAPAPPVRSEALTRSLASTLQVDTTPNLSQLYTAGQFATQAADRTLSSQGTADLLRAQTDAMLVKGTLGSSGRGL